MIFTLLAPILLILAGWRYHNKYIFYGCDKPNYFAIVSCFWNIGDFYSDLIFAMILLLTQHWLARIALAFAIVPHFGSNVVNLYNIQKWQNSNVYIGKYLSKYDWVLILISCLAG